MWRAAGISGSGKVCGGAEAARGERSSPSPRRSGRFGGPDAAPPSRRSGLLPPCVGARGRRSPCHRCRRAAAAAAAGGRRRLRQCCMGLHAAAPRRFGGEAEVAERRMAWACPLLDVAESRLRARDVKAAAARCLLDVVSWLNFEPKFEARCICCLGDGKDEDYPPCTDTNKAILWSSRFWIVQCRNVHWVWFQCFMQLAG